MVVDAGREKRPDTERQNPGKGTCDKQRNDRAEQSRYYDPPMIITRGGENQNHQ